MDDIAEKAKTLRKEGCTYKEIVEKLDGEISLDWCKRNLRTVKKEGTNDKCLEELIALGTRQHGVGDFEAAAVIMKHHVNATPDKIRYVKRRAKELNTQFLIRPEWIDYERPNESHKAINAFSLHLMDTVDGLVEDYLTMYPNSNPWSVKHELLKLAFSSKISEEPLAVRIQRNELISELLEERLTQQ